MNCQNDFKTICKCEGALASNLHKFDDNSEVQKLK